MPHTRDPGIKVPSGTWWHRVSSPVLRQYLDLVTRFATSEPLSLTGALEKLRGLLDCDVLMLLSRSLGEKGSRQVRRIARREDSHLRWEELVKKRAFQSIIDVTVAQSRRPPKPTQLVDWQPSWLWNTSKKDRAARIKKNVPFYTQEDYLRRHWPNLGPMALGLLGYVAIGDWPFGECLLVAANEYTEEDAEEGGVRAITALHLAPAFQAFLVFLSEVNAHFWRKKDVERRPLPERREQLRHEALQQAYVRSACRLAPLIGEDLGVTLETLVEIDDLRSHSRDGKAEEAVGEPTIADAERDLAKCYLCRKDEFHPPSDAESERCGHLVTATWTFARLLSKTRRARGKREVRR